MKSDIAKEILEIKNFPTSIERKDHADCVSGWHESLTRAYHCLAAVKRWNEYGIPQRQINIYIDLMEIFND